MRCPKVSGFFVEQLPQLDQRRFIVTKIHLQLDAVRLFHDCTHGSINDLAVEVGSDFVAYFELVF
jgi:hypothetical protein